MKFNKKSKIVASLMIIALLFALLSQSFVQATKVNENVGLALSRTRWVDNTEKDAYALNTGTNHPIFQIYSTSGTNKNTNYFCLNATAGATWLAETIGTETNYDVSYDMASDKTEIESLVPTYSNTVGTYYKQLMWLLDNSLIGTGYSDADIDALLGKAGIKKGEIEELYNGAEQTFEGYYYDRNENTNSVFSDVDSALYRDLKGNPTTGGYYYRDASGTIQNVKLSKELIESVEQAAIWYFTNYGNAEYDCLTKETDILPKQWIRYLNGSSNWTLISDSNKTVNPNYIVEVNGTDINVGMMLQEQASILYNYLVDEANKQAAQNYVSPALGTLSISYTGSNDSERMVKQGTDYKIGPLKVTKTGNTTLNGITVTTGTSNTPISSAKIQNASGNEITLPSINQNFYVIVPQSAVDESVTVRVTGNTTAIAKKLRIKETLDDTQAEQPIVEVTPTSAPRNDSITVTPHKVFDLALRKVITEVKNSDGEVVTIKSETEDKKSTRNAERTVNITESTIATNNTAQYKHRKDPVIVEKNGTITYDINIYNEGDIDGIATVIVDQLPTGLTSTKTSGTITSSLENTYNISFDSTTNKLTLTLDKTKTVTNIPAFNGTTLSKDTVRVTCKVNQEPGTGTERKYLTNIAYIAGEQDKDGNPITQDRDGNESKIALFPTQTATDLNSTDMNNYKGDTSNPSVNSDTNNNTYFKGQEDDDDFEKIVVLPKEFDLKLIKYISAINGVPQNRTITADASKLNEVENGKRITTADYDVTKVPLLVKKGDLVTYTFRVYNEGEVDGYAKEIKENIPEGLEYVASENTNPAWTPSNDGKTISTDYLSKAKGTSNLIKAFDGRTLSYKEVSVVLKVTTDENKKIVRNEAEISDEEDSAGNPVTDRDSTPDEWKKENSDDYYENNPNYPKYKEDDEDYDNIKLASFDLALRKFISKVSTDGNFNNTTTTTTYNRAPSVVTTDLKSGTAETAIYNQTKEPVHLNVGDYVLFTIRAYNEGDIEGYASQITDYLPNYLDFVSSTTDEYISEINSKWTQDSTDTKKIITNATAKNATTKLNAFNSKTDDGNGSGLSFVDVQIVCKVNSNAPSGRNLTNIAEITEYKKQDGETTSPKDRDSENNNIELPEENENQPENDKRPSYNGGTDTNKNDDYIPGQEDDDDFEKVVVRIPGKYNVRIIKEDENGEELDGTATFEVTTKLNGNRTGTTKTETVVGHLDVAKDVEINGNNVNNPDVYVIKETKAPDEYCEFGGIITITATKKVNGNSYSLDNLEYDVVDANGEKITSDNSKIYLKNGNIYVEVINYENPEIHKGVKTVENQDSGYDKDEDQSWSISSDIPGDIATYKTYKIVDDIDYRLNFSGVNSVVVKIGETTLEAGKDYKIEYTPNENGIASKTTAGTLTLTFIDKANNKEITNALKNNAGKKINVIFKTTFAKDAQGNLLAEVGTEIPNQAKLVYTNSSGTNKEQKSETPEVHTGGVTLFKYVQNGENKKALKNAEFSIYRTEADAKENKNAVQVAVSDENGVVKFIGLEYGEDASDKETNKKTDGTYSYDSSKQSTKYYVAETKAPEGYNPSTSVIEVTVNSTSFEKDATKIQYQVANERKPLDLALRKYIEQISADGKFENLNSTSNSERAPQVDSSKLKNGTASTAIYNHGKKPVEAYVGDYVVYTLRVYNEGEIAGFASEITDYLPEYLDFVESTDPIIKAINDNWNYDAQTRKVTTKNTAPNTTKLLKPYDKQNDDGKGSGLDYIDVRIICKINKDAKEGMKLTNIAEISEYKNEDGEKVEKDKDSEPNNIKYPENPSTYKDEETDKTYVPGEQDDDDFEKVSVKEPKKFDLALRKFITAVTDKEVTTRTPQVSYKDNKFTYEHQKDVLKVVVGDIVTYTLRAYNEGEVAGFAEKITDNIPENLEYLPDNAINKQYRWTMYDKDGKVTTNVADAVKVVTDYASKANGEELMKNNSELKTNPNLLKEFNPNAEVSDTNPSHVDVKIAFKVKDPGSKDIKITNLAQISEDANENGDPVEDVDSIPDKWNDGEDDQDYENVSVEYFDLALLKYLTKTIVTENGKTKTTETGNTGSDKDITPKVEIYRKNINKTVVKFEYVIKITNEGDIAGYAKEITDYVPEGLKFYKEDNSGWTDEGNNVISTKLLENTLLQPGESATVKVVLRWINGADNLGVKTNVAEISDDYNEKHVPDRDSTPDNKKTGEDDIDDAPVLLTISTGVLEHTVQYIGGALIILAVLGTGIAAIKKYVL